MAGVSMKDIPVAKIPEFEARLYEYMDNRYPQVLEAIRTTGKLEDATEEQLKAALEGLLKEF